MFEGGSEALSAPPITTEVEYEAVLAEVEPLLASEPAAGTPTYKRAMDLVSSIEVYETAQGWNMDESSDADYKAFQKAMVATSPNITDVSSVPDRLEPKDWTESVYRAALAELEPIFGTKRGTPDGDRALRLFDAIEAYETVHYPMGEPSAEAVARYERDKRGDY